MPKRLSGVLAVLLPLAALALWQLAPGTSEFRFFFSSPLEIARRAVTDYQQAETWRDIGITFAEIVLGLFWGTVLGSALGILLSLSDRLQRATRVYLTVLGAVPVFTISPLLIIWFGTGMDAKIFLAGFGVFLNAVIQSWEGSAFAWTHYADFTRTMAVPRLRVIGKIILPGAMDWLFSGMRLNIGVAVMGAFIAEFISSQQGLGHRILANGAIYDTTGVLFGLLNVVFLSVILNRMFDFLSRRILRK
jgi:NitT/TauT family transport system permease protein